MPLIFEPISLNRQAEYLDSLSSCPEKASDYSFVNLWGWAEVYGLYWAWAGEQVWIKQTKPRTSLWASVGPWESVNWKECLEEYSLDKTPFTRVPEVLVQYWKNDFKDRLTVKEARGHWDYLYSADELIKLSGNRFHKKKNLLNQFEKKYAYRYVPLKKQMVVMAMDMQGDWCTWRDCESSDQLSSENCAIERVLEHYEKLEGLMGGAILVDQKMVAYTVAEKISEDTLIIHFEKGDPAYKGVYQAINQMFLEHSGGNYATVNREQDLDDEGLRKAKLSYNPVGFLTKYNVLLS
jgi:hypothetical protein